MNNQKIYFSQFDSQTKNKLEQKNSNKVMLKNIVCKNLWKKNIFITIATV